MSGSFVLGVDLDGVCADHTAAFRQVVADELGVDPASLGEQTSWSYAEWGIDDATFLELHRRAVLEGRMFATMAPIEGAAEVLWRLSDAGVWIRIVTHRLYANWGHKVAVGDTVQWLDDHGIPYRDLCFLGDKPQVGADVYIDDAPHNVENLRAAGQTVIVFDQPYNRELGGERARTWDDVEEIVHGLAVRRGLPIQPQFTGFEYPPHRMARVPRTGER
ncbi:MAG: hypothetical protein JJU45_15650 [Acidimicrobiia bacterium]|nr:hypothetical protein [Acidimicrobiia bacterium]